MPLRETSTAPIQVATSLFYVSDFIYIYILPRAWIYSASRQQELENDEEPAAGYCDCDYV